MASHTVALTEPYETALTQQAQAAGLSADVCLLAIIHKGLAGTVENILLAEAQADLLGGSVAASAVAAAAQPVAVTREGAARAFGG